MCMYVYVYVNGSTVCCYQSCKGLYACQYILIGVPYICSKDIIYKYVYVQVMIYNIYINPTN